MALSLEALPAYPLRMMIWSADMTRVAAVCLALAGFFVIEGTVSVAEAQQRRRAPAEVTVTRPNWLRTPPVTQPYNYQSMRPDIAFGTPNMSMIASPHASQNFSPMGGSYAGRGLVVDWRWPAAWYGR